MERGGRMASRCAACSLSLGRPRRSPAAALSSSSARALLAGALLGFLAAATWLVPHYLTRYPRAASAFVEDALLEDVSSKGCQTAAASQDEITERRMIEDVSLTIFCAPKPFEDVEGRNSQLQALLSWLRLDPSVKVVLIGNSSLSAIAEKFPGRVTVDSDVDFNFIGTPMFHSLIARARAAETKFSLFINADIILLSDFLTALRKVADRFSSFVVTAMRWDIESMPFYFDEATQRLLTENDTEVDDDVVKQHIKEKGSLHTYGGVDFWAWNNGPVPFFEIPMPSFTFGRGRYDNWFTHEMAESNIRAVVDASDAITSVHVLHSYRHLKLQDPVEGNFWTINKKKNWETFANIHLSRTVGSFSSQMGTAMHLPWKLATCDEPASSHMCLSRRLKPFACRCEYSPYVMHTQSEPSTIGKKIFCGNIVVDNDIELPVTPTIPVVPGLPHTLEQLLNEVADASRAVTLVAASSRYREMLADFSCRCTALGAKNFLIAALDEDLYRFAFTQGLPVYFVELPIWLSQGYSLTLEEGTSDCQQNASCFHYYRQVKFYALLQILKRNYSVLWSDIDSIWMKNPFPNLQSLCDGCLLVESSVVDVSLAANGPPPDGIDSGGLIFAHPDLLIVKLFEELLDVLKAKWLNKKSAEHTPLYSLVCGTKGETRGSALDECRYKGHLPVVFLPREDYVTVENSADWTTGNVLAECRKKGCQVVHNRLKGGGTALKMRHLEETGLWRFDAEQKMCRHHWTAKSDAFQVLPT